jgi:hypothetical protein
MIRNVIQQAYDTLLRPRLPKKIVVHNGVAVRSGGLFDATDVKPAYEGSLIAAMRERIRPGETVAMVGGGKGVSAVVAARIVGPAGAVTVYEGAASQLDVVTETLELNQVADRVKLKHGVVGDPQELWSEAADAERVPPGDLPPSDTLVLDCEGSELSILREADLPDTVIVETHGVFDAPTEEAKRILEDRGFEVIADRVEIADEDVHVLTGVRR